jgi:hypothetical protein
MLVASALCILSVSSALAQGEELVLSIAKNWGYAWRGEMQGLFTLEVSGPVDMSRATFLLDGRPLGEVSGPPFTMKLSTDDHSLGPHTLGATGVTADGRTLHAREEHVTFVSAERGWQIGLSIAGPIIGLALGFMVVMTLTSLLGARRRTTAPGMLRGYGMLGGAVCPRCGRPFARHAYSLNWFSRRYDRCPHCSRWSWVKAAAPAELRAAEDAEAPAAAITTTDPEAELRRALEDSRYVDN